MLACLTDPVSGQEIESRLSGNSAAQNFSVKNNRGGYLFMIRGDGKVGVGTAAPDAALHVNGSFRLTGGSPGTGKVLTSDADGLASWNPLPPNTLPLPYSDTISATSAAFQILNTGDGDGIVGITSATNGFSMIADNQGQGYGMMARTSAADKPAFLCRNVSTSTSAPAFILDDGTNMKMKVDNDGGFVVRGSFSTGSIPASGYGVRMMFYPSKAAFRAGYVQGIFWEDSNIGLYSTAMGLNTTASGTGSTAMGGATTASGSFSTAMGESTNATGHFSVAMGRSSNASGQNALSIGYATTAGGDYSIAMGASSTASGNSSTAMGALTTASGTRSTAMGHGTTASGNYSTAMGALTTASGGYSTAMGYSVSTASYMGSFIIGDASTNNVDNSTAYNQMSMRFAGGYRLFSNSSLTTGVYMNAGVSGWTNYCDRNRKENFIAIDGESVLARLRAIPVLEWNYKGADASVRYIGPMAQDFWQAFRLGGTDSLGINSISIDGVNMAAIQALEKRTSMDQRNIIALQTMLNAKDAEIRQLREQLDAHQRNCENRYTELMGMVKTLDRSQRNASQTLLLNPEE